MEIIDNCISNPSEREMLIITGWNYCQTSLCPETDSWHRGGRGGQGGVNPPLGVTGIYSSARINQSQCPVLSPGTLNK